MKKILFGLFFLYCVLLAEILILGRKADLSLCVNEYFLAYTNLCPFRTVARYVGFFWRRRDLLSLRLILFNIGGNFLLFFPMGCFLPVLFSCLRAFSRCFFVILATVFLTEALQGMFRVGIPDIDDLIVNMLGACSGMQLAKKSDFAENGSHRTRSCGIHFE